MVYLPICGSNEVSKGEECIDEDDTFMHGLIAFMTLPIKSYKRLALK